MGFAMRLKTAGMSAYCARCKRSVTVVAGAGTTRTCTECGRSWGNRQPEGERRS